MTKKILVIKLGALGDVVLASAAFSAVRKRFPESKIYLLTTPGYFPLVENCPYFTKVFLYDRKRNFILEAGRVSSLLKKENVQMVLNLQNNLKSNILAWRSGAPERIGFRKGMLPGLLTKSVRYHYEENGLWNINQLLSLAGCGPSENMELYLAPDADSAAEKLLRSAGWREEGLLGLHTGSSPEWPSKRWPKENWICLAENLSEKGFLPVFLGDEEEVPEVRKIVAGIKGKTINLVGKTSLPVLPAVIRKCLTFISTDSGPLFLAAAAGIKTMGLYGPTDSKRHAPPGIMVFEKTDLPCRPCYHKRCREPVCLENITPDLLYDSCFREKE